MKKKFSAAASIFFDEGILRSSQSKTFKKDLKINTSLFYRKNANIFPINVLYKICQIFNQKNSWKLTFTEKKQNFVILRLK